MARGVVVAASVVAGACWLLALLLPWTTAGPLSSASLLDAVELIRAGSVDAIVPSPAAVLLLVPALAGIVLIGGAGLSGCTSSMVRGAALVLGSIASLGLALLLTGVDATTAGPGAWAALAGVLAAGVTAIPALESWIRPTGRRTHD